MAFYYSFLDFFFKGYGYHSASVSFYTLMSIVPLFIVLTVILSFIAIAKQDALINILHQFFPEITKDFIFILKKISEKSAIFGIVGFAVSFYFASRIFISMHTAITNIFEVKEIGMKKTALIYFLGVPIFIGSLLIIYFSSMILSFSLEIITSSIIWKYFEDIIKFFHLQWLISFFIDISKFISFITFFIIIFVVYYYFPPIKRKSIKHILFTSVFVSAVLVLLKILFGMYIAIASKTNPVYGSLSGIFAFLTWLYLSFSMILIGSRALFYLYQNSKSKSL